jgi:hypothetical protein
MKLLLEIESPGLENGHAYEAELSKEIGAFVSRLVKSRTGVSPPRVTILSAGPDAVIVDANALLRLQRKAVAK